MKRLLILAAVLLAAVEMYGVPAKRVVRTVSNSDGSMVDVVLCGDETFHFYATSDGMPLVKTERGYEYAHRFGSTLRGTGVVAHRSSERATSEQTFLHFNGAQNKYEVRELWTSKNKVRNAHRLSRNNYFASRRAALQESGNSQKAPKRADAAQSETKKGLVILVNFSDKSLTYSKSDFNSLFNDEGYNKNKHIGSVRDYFKDQSYGQLIIDFDVAGPYTLSNKLSYYGENDSQGDDKYPGKMIAEACNMANADVNFSDYDWDGDGEVDQVYVIYAGYGEASGAAENTVWPHEWALSASDYGRSLRLDGVTIDTYACSNELTGTSGSTMDGIGTACHEFSHCLGLPDLYDTSGDNFGMSVWSIMDYGCYNGPSNYEGNVPCAYTAYERFYSGWITPTELSEGCLIKDMEPITSSADSYIIYNDNNKNEYYLLTNIQKESWNTYAYGHGMLVIHVDYSESAWYNNEVNNTATHQRCTIIPADNAIPSLSSSYSTWQSLSGDPYPGTSKNTSLTNTSTPTASLFNNNTDGRKFMNKPIEDIAEADGKISFTFNGGPQLDVPTPEPVTPTSTDSFTASWSAVEEATSYTLELFDVYDSPVILMMQEDFSKLRSSGLNSSTDVSSTLDQYTTLSGWSGIKLFKDLTHNIKLGSSKQAGSITTPTLDSPASGNVTVYLVSSPYGLSPSTNIEVNIGKQSQTLTCSGNPLVATFENITEAFNVAFSALDKRAYIDEIRIYDGALSLEDIKSLDASSSKRRIAVKRSVQVIEGITETSYTFTDLDKDEYYYRVKAIDPERTSQWSDFVHVEMTTVGIPGDVNSDGNVDISDVVCVVNTIAGIESWPESDVDGDEKTTISDVVAIINIIAGIATTH